MLILITNDRIRIVLRVTLHMPVKMLSNLGLFVFFEISVLQEPRGKPVSNHFE